MGWRTVASARPPAASRHEAAVHGDVASDVSDGGRYERRLLSEAVDECRLVVAGDLRRRLAEQRLGAVELALVAVGVDDPNTGRRYGGVVDVRPRAGDAPIVQDRNVRAVLRERLLDEFLAVGATRPASLVLWGVLQREDDAAECRWRSWTLASRLALRRSPFHRALPPALPLVAAGSVTRRGYGAQTAPSTTRPSRAGGTAAGPGHRSCGLACSHAVGPAPAAR